MRLFFSINLPESVRATVEELQQNLIRSVGNEGVRWTKPSQFHFTLKFLGDIRPAELDRLADIAKMACEELSPFDLNLATLGGFPNNERPSVFWLGAASGQDALVEMEIKLNSLLELYGVHGDKRLFHPHITLARVNGYQGEASVAKALVTRAKTADMEIHIDRFALMQSQLSKLGSDYKLLREFVFES